MATTSGPLVPMAPMVAALSWKREKTIVAESSITMLPDNQIAFRLKVVLFLRLLTY